METIKSFPPLVDENTRILIIGTMPGVTSLSQNMYYANENNHFWDFVYRILDDGYSINKVVEKKGYKQEHYQFLLESKIGLWDVIKECTREGSNDSKIQNPTYNEIASVIKDEIQVVLCNGEKAYTFLRKSKQLKTMNVPVRILGSTSTMSPTNTFKVLNQWREEIYKWL